MSTPPALPRSLPSVDAAVRALGPTDLPAALVTAVVRREIDRSRQCLLRGESDDPMVPIRSLLAGLKLARLRPVVNATGILIHTNLGRSPLSPSTVAAISRAAAGYTNLEFDLTTGDRGPRAGYLEQTLAALCDTEAAVAVNNCAAALVLMVLGQTTPARPAVLISRGEMVQIGGGFRVHEILASAGVTLTEVGATNQTSLADYRSALSPAVAAILKIHRANFFMDGFVASPATADLAALAAETGVPLLEDLGSGATDAFNAALVAAGLDTEPTARQSPADAVCFSGDKLLGGPQAGIIAGKKDVVAAAKKHPLFRAMRCDKLTLSGLSATVDELLAGRPTPVLQMLATPAADLTRRAEWFAAQCPHVRPGTGMGMIGGGALPRARIGSVTLDVRVGHLSADDLSAKLRAQPTPVIGYVRGGVFKLDLRTVFPDQDSLLLESLRQL